MRLTEHQFVALASRPRTGRPAGSKDTKQRKPGSGLYQREATIQKSVLAYLNLHPLVAFAYRMNTGVLTIENRIFKAAFRGCSDIIGQMKDGRFIAIEIKRPNRKPTEEQAAFLAKVQANNGVAFVATSIEDVDANLR